MNTTTILLIDDHPLFRRGLVNLFAETDDFTVVGEASNGVEGVALATRLQPQIILLDLHMATMAGIETLKILKAEGLASTIVVLTASMNRQEFMASLKAGADGYILKDTSAERILALLRNEGKQRLILDDELERVLRECADASPITSISLQDLTERERQTLELISRGMSNKLIARQMNLSDGTVKIYVRNLLRKLQVNSRLEVAALAHGYDTLEERK